MHALTHPLLQALDEVVRSDVASAHLSGSVVVAIKSEPAAAYWHAAFREGELMGCGPLNGLPPDADAVLLFEPEQADAVLAGVTPGDEVARFGSDTLLRAFVARYCAFQSSVAVRAGG